MREHLIIRIIYISFPILEVLRASVGYLCTRTRPPFLLIFYHLRFQRVARNHIFLFYFPRRRRRNIRYGRWIYWTLRSRKRRIVPSTCVLQPLNTVGLPSKPFYGLFKRTRRVALKVHNSLSSYTIIKMNACDTCL